MLDEKKIVTWALVLLFLALSIVYSLTYVRKAEVFKTPSTTSETSFEQTEIQSWDGDEILVIETEDTGTQATSQESLPVNQIRWDTLSNTSQTVEVTDLASTNPEPSVVVQLLPGTTQYQGSLDIIDVLGVTPDYILQDSRGNYFASYGTRGLEFVRTVQQLGGNVYAMVTESEILKNELFGDKVSFINMTAFKDKWVIMVIEIGGKTWLLQVPTGSYHSSKAYLKSLFT